MKHNIHKDDLIIVKPIEFNKYTEKTILSYCLGANLYMPATKNVVKKIVNKELDGLTTMSMCFEDAIKPEDLNNAITNVLAILDELSISLNNRTITINDIPLIFIRVRDVNQFKTFAKVLTKERCSILTGFTFPKFSSINGDGYFSVLEQLNKKHTEILYGMPILETGQIIYKPTRMDELLKIKNIIDKYHKYVLNVRVGATDFSSNYGVRRGVDYTIYDINVIKDCLTDIINIFSYIDDEDYNYTLSAPVWEYFSNENSGRLLKPRIREYPFNIDNLAQRRKEIINNATDGLIREVILDKANGFIGKTVIHPSHLKIVNSLQAITKEEYDDARAILNSSEGGVFKSSNNNKMNEINPHTNWAKVILKKALAYGVVENSSSYIKLFVDNE